jgi:copper(I)-binding protein
MGDRAFSIKRYVWPGAVAVAASLFSGHAAAVFVVNEPWVVPATRWHSTEAYVNLTSSEGSTLVSVVGDVTADIGLHAAGRPGPEIARLPLPASATIKLAPGGTRIVLAGLTRSLKPGDRVTLKLVLEDANGSRQEIAVDAEVRWRSPTDDHRRGHSH